MPTKAELQAALRTQEHTLKEARSREAYSVTALEDFLEDCEIVDCLPV